MNRAAAEVPGLARVGAEMEAVGCGEGDHAAYGVVVAGMTATGDVHALDDGAECRGESGWFVLTEVAVEVEGGHGGSAEIRRISLIGLIGLIRLIHWVEINPSRWGRVRGGGRRGSGRRARGRGGPPSRSWDSHPPWGRRGA